MTQFNNEKELIKKFIETNSITVENFSTKTYTDILELIINNRYGVVERNYKLTFKDKNYFGGRLQLNAKTNTLYKNLLLLEFKMFYSQILFGIVNDYEYNYKEFAYAYKVIYLLYNELMVDSDIRIILRIWLNHTYAYLGTNVITSKNKDNSDTKDIRDNITTIASRTLNDIVYNYPNEVLYVDTDTIFFKFNKELMTSVSNLKYTYDIEYLDNTIFIAKKKYITYDNDSNVKTIGIRTKY